MMSVFTKLLFYHQMLAGQVKRFFGNPGNFALETSQLRRTTFNFYFKKFWQIYILWAIFFHS